ncbi:accessory secretory protein Asp1 [Staphylococcus auricularis]
MSAIRNYDENGQDVNQQYMTADGDCILTEDLVTKQIVVSDKYRHRFDQAEYATMTEFIQAQFKHYTAKHYQVDDVTIAAADDRHNALITENIAPEHLCFSIYSQRNKELNDQTLASVHKGQYWLVDRQDHEAALMLYQSKHHLDNQLMRITPFDAQVLPNISSQLYETYIGLWLDGLVEQDMQRIVTSLTAYIQAHEGYRLLLLTKHDQNEVSPWLKEHIKIINDKYNEVEPDDEGVNQLVAEDEDYVKLLELQHVPFEMDLFEVVSKLRIVIELNQEPDLFLQICSISAGLPQINQRETEYVTHDKNGKIISSEVEMIAALDYFLDHLKHWNYSFAYSIKLVDEYASEQIIDQLDRLIEGEMHGA